MYVEDLLLLSGGFLISSDRENLIVNRHKLDPLNERIIEKIIIGTLNTITIRLPSKKFL